MMTLETTSTKILLSLHHDRGRTGESNLLYFTNEAVIKEVRETPPFPPTSTCSLMDLEHCYLPSLFQFPQCLLV